LGLLLLAGARAYPEKERGAASMSAKICPLMGIAKINTELRNSNDPICLEHGCAWWIKQKEHYGCAFVLFTLSIAAIGLLYAQSRGVK